MADEDREPFEMGDTEGSDGAAPLEELADRIRNRESEPEGDEGDSLGADAEVDEEFMDMGATIGTPESDRTEAPSSDTVFEEPSDDLFDFEPAVEAGEAVDEHVVPKRSYCESCEYLTDPPEFRCTHDGTTIVEFVDTDHVRVRACPIVAERQLLGEFEE